MTPEEMIKDYILTSVEIFIIFFLFSSLRSAFSRIRKLSFVLKVLVAVASFAVFVVFRIYYLPNIFLLNKIDPEELVTVMKAAEFAPNEKFRVITAPVPIPTDFEVLVKVKAVSLNPVDYKLNKAKMPILRWIRAHTPVQDVSGVVVLPGKHCGPIYAGDEVFGLSQKGALAEYALISCSLITIKPKNLPFADAAALPTASVGYLSLVPFFQDSKNSEKTLLIVGASGGCGLFAVALGKALHVGKVIGISSAKNKDLVLQAGATDFIDYTAKDFNEQIQRLHGKVDVVYDTVSSFEDHDYYPSLVKTLKPNDSPKAQYIGINGLVSDWVYKLLSKAITESKNFQKPRFDLLVESPPKEHFDQVAALAAQQGVNLVPVKGAVFKKLTEETVNEGFSIMHSRRTTGKIVYDFSD